MLSHNLSVASDFECDQAKIVNTPTQHFNYKEPDELRYKWDDTDIEYKWPKYVKKGG